MLKLTVVNRMLKTLGERSLTSLTDSHRMLGDCLATLDTASKQIQSQGWWYNMETVTLAPSLIDESIYLPNDCLSVRAGSREVAKRGSRLYALDKGSYVFTTSQEILLIREVLFESIPESGAALIAATAVRDFQIDFDADRTKLDIAQQRVVEALALANSEHTRNRQVNFLHSNTRLQQLKRVTSGARRYIRG